jgi:dolichol-phosphate mannosyltransferase
MRVSVVSSAFNEELCIAELGRRLILVAEALPTFEFEFILVDNGSADRTWQEICLLGSSDCRFRGLRLSRNFGFDGGLTAGLDAASGDCCVLMASDLQDEPEKIPQMLNLWMSGSDQVVIRVSSRASSSPIRRFASAIFYYFANSATNGMLPRNVSDFRLVDRKVYEVVRQMPERTRFMRGLWAWVGFETSYIEAPRPERFAGGSKASFRVVAKLARHGIFSFSDTPLRAISALGLIGAVVSVISVVIFVVLRFALGTPFPGFLTLLVITLFVFSALSLMIGIVAEYVALLMNEVKQRPNFIVAEDRRFEIRDS